MTTSGRLVGCRRILFVLPLALLACNRGKVSVVRIIVLVWIVVTVPAILHAHTIEVSASEFQYECQLSNTSGPGLRTIYVRHTFNPGSIASRFKVMAGPGATMTYLSETHPFLSTEGNSQSGLSVCYGACIPGDVLVASIAYFSSGTDENCSKLLVVPHPLAETVEVLDCAEQPAAAFVRDLHIRAPGGVPCGCPVGHGFQGVARQFDCSPVPTAGRTWGAIKALYRN